MKVREAPVPNMITTDRIQKLGSVRISCREDPVVVTWSSWLGEYLTEIK